MTKMKAGLVGCGNIGADLCIALQKGDIPAEFVALTDIDASRAEVFLRTFKLDAQVCSLEDNVAAVDLVVECADASAVPAVIETSARYGRDCLIMSMGCLVDRPDLFDLARENGIQLHMPSGALCGLDGIRAAIEAGLNEKGLHSVTLTTRKPPQGLAGSPYLREHEIDVEALTEPMVVFEGTAKEAVKAFPLSVSVAAALSLTGIGEEKTRVRVIADPHATLNVHEIVAEGAFGRLQTVTENLPSPRNVKSSYLASLSACAELRRLATAFALHK